MKTTLLLTALLFSMGSLDAQPRVVLNLAPDGPGDPALLRPMLAAFASSTASRTPLKIPGDTATAAFVVPSCANVAGLYGAFYKTELKLATHWLSSSIKVDFVFVPNGPPPSGGLGGTGVVSYPMTLQGNTIYLWEDILATLGVSGVGWIAVQVDSSTHNQSAYTMTAWANTYTSSPSGGVYRTSVPIISIGNTSAYAYLNGNLNQDSSTRNNIFLANIASQPLTLQIYGAPAGGSWGTPVTLTLAPGESEQYPFASLFPGVTGSDLNIQFVPISGEGTLWVGYTIRTDNVTNSGMVEMPQVFDYYDWPE